MSKHSFYVPQDHAGSHEHDAAPLSCPICQGGLSICKTCGGAEGSLTTDCPEAPVTYEQIVEVYEGRLDFVGGRWVDGPSPSCPAGAAGGQYQ